MSTDSAAPAAERLGPARLLLPQEIDEELLARYFALSEEDKEEILRSCRGVDNKLGFALALSWFRMTGRFPTSYEVIPLRAVNDLARQLGLPDPVLVLAYPGREATKWEHEHRIRDYLGVRPFDKEAQRALTAWVTEETLAGESDENLLPRAEDLLRRRDVELPGLTVLDRLIRHTLTEASEECVQRVLRRLAPAQEESLWGLLEKPSGEERPVLARVKRLSLRASAASLKELCRRVRWFREKALDRIDLSEIRAAVVARLASVVEDHGPAFLKRMGRERAVAYLACFATDIQARTIDTILETNDRLLVDVRGDARADYLEWMRSRHDATEEPAELLAQVVGRLLTAQGAVAAAWEEERTRHSEKRLAEAVSLCSPPSEGARRSDLDDLVRRYGYLRRFAPAILDTLQFEAIGEGRPVLEAIEFLRAMNTEKRRKFPDDAPLAWAEARWRRKIERSGGKLARRAWETGLWFTVKEKLRAGVLNVRGSRLYRPRRDLVYGDRAWADARAAGYRDLGYPQDPREHVAQLVTRFGEIGRELDDGFPENPGARLEKGRLIVSPDPASASPLELKRIKGLLEDEMLSVDLDEMLIQVAHRVPFLRHLRPSSGNESRTPDLERRLLICLFGLGCNLDISRLARSTGVGREALSDLIRRYFRAENLIDPNAELVNYHHGLSISRLWGTGERSGADGQRREIRGRSVLAGFLPRYFGHLGRGFTVYRHTLDQYGILSAMAISCLKRESLYMLDGLVANRTRVRPKRPSTDTHGATKAVFWMATFLGYDYCPRIAQIARRRLFKIPGVGVFKNIELLFEREPLDLSIVVEEWDPLVRIAASVKDGLVAPSVILRQMENASSGDRTAQAAQTLGTAYETMFLMRYLQHPGFRREIRQQQNRCEAENDLANFVSFGERGIYRSGDLAFVVDKVQCEAIIMNAIVVWNTLMIEKVVARLRKRGLEIPDAVLAHLSPLMRKHINPYGEYAFDIHGAGVIE